MVNYIQEGFGNHDLWILDNSTWVTYGGYDSLRTGNGIAGGYGKKSYADIINNNWKFTISASTGITANPRGIDRQFFLDGDANPIIFRTNYDDPEDFWTFYIIYNEDIKASLTVAEFPVMTSEIYRLGSIYYFTSSNLSFDYGSEVKPVKLKLATAENNISTKWYNLSWYYTTQDEDYCFVT